MILKTLEILQKVKNNELTIEQAQKMIEQPLDYATIDYNRKKRTGNNEVIYGAGKTKEQIIGIVKDMLDHDIHSILITRVDQEKSEAILKEFPQMILYRTFVISMKIKKKSIKEKLLLFVREHQTCQLLVKPCLQLNF